MSPEPSLCSRLEGEWVWGGGYGDVGEGGGMTARLRLNAPWLRNCVRQDCDISHSE